MQSILIYMLRYTLFISTIYLRFSFQVIYVLHLLKHLPLGYHIDILDYTQRSLLEQYMKLIVYILFFDFFFFCTNMIVLLNLEHLITKLLGSVTPLRMYYIEPILVDNHALL